MSIIYVFPYPIKLNVSLYIIYVYLPIYKGFFKKIVNTPYFSENSYIYLNNS